MKIDFNNVRRSALAHYKGLIITLQSRCDGRTITVDVAEIEHNLNNLRDCLVGIACTYQPGDSEFQDVLGDERVLTLGEDLG